MSGRVSRIRLSGSGRVGLVGSAKSARWGQFARVKQVDSEFHLRSVHSRSLCAGDFHLRMALTNGLRSA